MRLETIRSWLLMFTVAWCGAVVMALEIMGTRIIAPLFGASLFVWTALISTTLLSLAAGYCLGGYLADKHSGGGGEGEPVSARNEDLVYVMLGVCALWLLVLPLFKGPLMLLGMKFGLRGGALLTAALLFFLPLGALGAVGPLAIRVLSRRLEVVGRKVGLIYAVSTLGSVFGTLAVGFWLLPVIGLKTILLILAVSNFSLCACYFALRRRGRRVALIVLAALIGGALAGAAEDERIEGIVYAGQSVYGQLAVLELGDNRLLLLDGIVQSGVNMQDMLSCFDYITAIERLAFAYHPEPQRWLMIGVGGGVMATSLRRRGVSVDLVDIDARMGEVSREFFGLPPGPGAFYPADGRAYLENSVEKYDVIVLDVYSGESCPAHLTSLEAFAAAGSRLRGDGLLIINFLGRLSGPEAVVTNAVGRTLLEVFGRVYMHYRGSASDFNNVFFVAMDGDGAIDFSKEVPVREPLRGKVEQVLYRRMQVEATRGMILTDDYNPVDYLDWRMREHWRAETVRFLGAEKLARMW